MLTFYQKLIFAGIAMFSTETSFAIDLPKIGQTITDGKSYILINYEKPNKYWSRTPWDGAYYLLDYSSSSYKTSTFTAHQEADGTWYFTVDGRAEEEEPLYVGFQIGAANLNGNLELKAHFVVEPSTDHEGFYKIKSGDDMPSSGTRGLYLHLNSGGEYVVITFNGNQWFPDYYGGYETIDDGSGTPIVKITEDDWIVPLDREHENWAFADTADIPAYYQKVRLYEAITEIEQNRYGNETYLEGYQSLVALTSDIYNKADVTIEELGAAYELIQLKHNLYNEIVKAKELLGEDTDAVLTAAIAKAVSSFNSVNTEAEIEQAISDLANAELNYSLGNGDITDLGKNMSFEDLSAQGGVETSVVGATPAGWNAYVNGTQVSTTEELTAAGVSGWYGINSDSEGDIKDGTQAFGIWMAGMPDYEISQTISGLENGTYLITAGVMVGANGSGSRRTSQRVFGNLNSTLYGFSDDYDLSRFNPQEVLAFAGQTEEVTDRLLSPITVNAYVYDGNLTFGFRTDGDIAKARRDNGNANGGDGWFKLDNFRIQKLGYIKEDALAIFEDYTSKLSNYMYEAMQNSVLKKIEAALEEYSVNNDSEPQTIDNAILNLAALLTEVKASVDVYAEFASVLIQHQSNLTDYSNYAGAGAYGDVIMEAEDLFGSGDASAEELAEMRIRLEQAFNDCKLSGVAVNIFVTDLITNPSFEDLSAQGNTPSSGVAAVPAGWTLKLNGETVEGTPNGYISGWCAINGGDAISVTDNDGNYYDHQPVDGSYLWGIWTSSMPEVELSQTISGLPMGTYIAYADVMVENNWAGNNVTTQRIFANDCVQVWATPETISELNIPADVAAAKAFDEQEIDNIQHLTYAGYTCESGDATTSLLKPMEVTFGVGEDGIAVIGFRTNGVNVDGNTYGNGAVNGAGWFKVDNFRLFYKSEETPTAINNATSGNSIEIVGQEYYNANGQRVSGIQPGLTIVKNRLADGTVKAVKIIKR